MKLCAVIPTFNNPHTLKAVVQEVQTSVPNVIVVDDGSHAEAREVAIQLNEDPGVTVVFRKENGGKGAAVKDGLSKAHKMGFSHALQIDADGQHNTEDIPRLRSAAEKEPKALVLAAPEFDASAPKSRLWGRKITLFWTRIETVRPIISDPMCGFRIYPIEPALEARARGNAMDFDPEIAVKLAWTGLPVINVPTQVRYLTEEDGGVSHFRMFWDNVLISWMHTRLVVAGILRLLIKGVSFGRA